VTVPIAPANSSGTNFDHNAVSGWYGLRHIADLQLPAEIFVVEGAHEAKLIAISSIALKIWRPRQFTVPIIRRINVIGDDIVWEVAMPQHTILLVGVVL
jgi:hypothetical protein